ncbi:MAG: hypothetical protein AB8F95_16320 [Bacteroidia bacterium]
MLALKTNKSEKKSWASHNPTPQVGSPTELRGNTQTILSTMNSKIIDLHTKITFCNNQTHPHHIYTKDDFLFIEIQNLHPQDLHALEPLYVYWSRKEKYILKFLIFRYSKRITHINYWLPKLYKDDFSSHSQNRKTLETYHFLLKNEHHDTDYWWAGGGDHELIYHHLENSLTQNDWEDLKNDLTNWTVNQLEIFSYCIINGEGRFDGTGKDNDTILNRIDLLPSLLSISKKKDRMGNDIGAPLWEHPEFVNVGPPKSRKVLLEIARLCGYPAEDVYATKNDGYLLVEEIRKALKIDH